MADKPIHVAGAFESPLALEISTAICDCLAQHGWEDNFYIAFGQMYIEKRNGHVTGIINSIAIRERTD
jgi:hypothetical protein